MLSCTAIIFVNFFSFTVDPFSEWRKKFDRLTFPESVIIPLMYFNICFGYNVIYKELGANAFLIKYYSSESDKYNFDRAVSHKSV